MLSLTFQLPRFRTLARRAAPHLVEGTLVPVVLFYATMQMFGIWGALGASVVWSYAAVARRLLTRRPVPGILVLGVVTLTARTVISVASGSVFLYFLQPTLGTALVAAVFLLSVPAGRPLAARLAGDFCPLPESFAAHDGVRRFFARISILWSFVYLTNASITLWLLTHQPVATYVLAKPIVSLGSTACGIAASVIWFHRSMHRHGIKVLRASATVPAA